MKLPLLLHRFMPALCLAALALASWPAAQSTVAAPNPAARAAASHEAVDLQAAAEKDHRRLLDLLGIKALRPPAVNDQASPYAANYDEARTNFDPASLPDPLLADNGVRIATADAWWTTRRPQIVAAFDRAILGRPPANPPAVTWQVVSTTPEQIAGMAVVTRRLAGRVDNSLDPQISVTLDATLTTPAHAAGPVPVIVYLAFPDGFKAALARPLADAPSGAWGDYGHAWERQVLARGWGIAVLSPTSFQADSGAGLTAGIIGLMNQGRPRSLDDWGTLRAWAWGASRLLDYLQTDKAVDARQVGLAGHSRYGKAALVAMAYDPRFAILYASSSGEAGAKLYRRNFGEQITNIASPALYHWMSGNFLRYAGPLTPSDLPVDSHELIALCAPRPVFIGSGAGTGDGFVNPNGDAWADPQGMFLAEVYAGPVYRLLGKKGLETTHFPPIETPLLAGQLAFRQHAGGHTPAPNWPTFLEFAGHYLHAPQAAASRTR